MTIMGFSSAEQFAPILCPDSVPCAACTGVVALYLDTLLGSFLRGDLDELEWFKSKAQARYRKAHAA